MNLFCSPDPSPTTVDFQTVCCMCGDVGFSDKLFRCNKCRHRFQHSYCSNYYGESSEIKRCDWCRSEEIRSPASARQGNSSSKGAARSEYSAHKITKRDQEAPDKAGKSSGGPSPRQATRRYKLLKDVMC
ncbi:hypothetical protein SAY86_000783 [Trapa natans]|uniref:PHD-type zinc finger plants domain-containing protein n=1 Tax=Trapa natans TaxID=22666 RepID=A0AAN7RGZ4_TRANT|nr:hypothetical protein SAY86_000783 [Trapa natans]